MKRLASDSVQSSRVMLTPPQVAERYGVTAYKVLLWVRSGELRGINLAVRANGRPRWRISPEDLAEFESGRQAVVPIKAPRRRKSAVGVTKYF